MVTARKRQAMSFMATHVVVGHRPRKVSRLGRRLASMLVITAGVWVVLPATPASAAPIMAACAGTTVGTTFTLTADCDTTVPLTVPDGFTVDGAGHKITAHDGRTVPFMGAVVTNAGTSMHLRNLTIQGTGFAVDSAANSRRDPVRRCGRQRLQREGVRHHPGNSVRGRQRDAGQFRLGGTPAP